ncbi:CPBP family intramembrane glutamic endopeptidase [Oribacterium sp. WCC10]|uniref:CPBP family intramembrane glutamic endopeptidase n=1 Tax=Oribacterium sp. WCC10 TaxID=1855343 RepID=UPI0008ED2537|nr:CPBP family intramembrane glutamic endopeptidase [Oribacterium sp. WCC10]SFG73234.1 CAAX protease self-immunity [Oribacterium sp. WCC10]
MEKLENKSRSVFALSLVSILILIVTNKICEKILPGYTIPGSENLLIKIFMVIISVIAVILVLCGKLSFSFSCFRISKDCNFKREMMEAVTIILIYAAVLFGYRLYKNSTDPVFSARPLFALYLNINFRWFYPLSALWQELLIKPLWQDNVKQAMGGKKWSTLIYIGLLFCIYHMHFPLYYLSAAGVLCMLTGILYERDKNIWGVWALHFCLGFLPRAVGLA